MKMMNKTKKSIRVILLIMLSFIVIVNMVGFMHAYRFTHFVSEGAKTKSPEKLSLFEKINVLFTGVSIPKQKNSATPGDYGYDYRTVTIVGPDNLETVVWEIMGTAANRSVILFHGYSSRKGHLLPVADFLLKNHSNVVLVDFPGHGDSPYDWSTLGEREADVVNAVFQHYKGSFNTPIILHGFSMGASSILIAIHRHHIPPHGIILEMPYGSLYETVKNRFKLMGFPFTFPFAELLVLWGGIQFGYNGFKLNPSQFAGSVTTPALVLGGEKDRRVSPKSFHDIYKNLKGRKEIFIFKKLGHESFIKKAEDEYRASVIGFLN